jgi:hypothetical protein
MANLVEPCLKGVIDFLSIFTPLNHYNLLLTNFQKHIFHISMSCIQHNQILSLIQQFLQIN